jgi:hypothetical protein
MIDLADKLLPIAPPLLLVTGVGALVLIFAKAPSQRVVPLVALAVVLIGEICWIIFHARSPDDYFDDGTTRWDFAAKGAGQGWVVAAIAVASASVVVLLIAASARGRDYLARVALASAAVSSFLLLFRLVRPHRWALSSASSSAAPGNRPSFFFEKTRSPSASTSN